MPLYSLRQVTQLLGISYDAARQRLHRGAFKSIYLEKEQAEAADLDWGDPRGGGYDNTKRPFVILDNPSYEPVNACGSSEGSVSLWKGGPLGEILSFRRCPLCHRVAFYARALGDTSTVQVGRVKPEFEEDVDLAPDMVCLACLPGLEVIKREGSPE